MHATRLFLALLCGALHLTMWQRALDGAWHEAAAALVTLTLLHGLLGITEEYHERLLDVVLATRGRAPRRRRGSVGHPWRARRAPLGLGRRRAAGTE
jgi:hypothetical protein